MERHTCHGKKGRRWKEKTVARPNQRIRRIYRIDEKKMMKKNEHRPERERKREEKKGRSRLEGKKERHTLHA